MAFDAELADRLRALVHGEDGVSEKRMFGGLAFLVHGHMAVSASSTGCCCCGSIPPTPPALVADPRAEPFEMRGRAMDGWLRVDAAGMTDDQLRKWVAHGVAYARSLPPKR